MLINTDAPDPNLAEAPAWIGSSSRTPSSQRRSMAFTSRSLFEMLQSSTRRDPDALALVGRTEAISYGALLSLVCRIARRIGDVIPEGEPIATLVPQTPSGIAAILGCAVAGHTCIILNRGDPLERQAAILANSAPTALVIDQETALPRLSGAITVLPLEELTGSFEPGEWFPLPPMEQDAPAFVHYTSGSSGKPKGIAASTRSILYRAFCCVEAWRLTEADRLLATSLPSVQSGFCFIVAVLGAGARMLLVDLAKEGATAALRHSQRERPTVLSCGPPIARMLFRLEGASAAFASVRAMRIGSASLLPSDLSAWRRVLPHGCEVSHTYASTEALIVAEWVIPAGFSTDETALPAGYFLPEQEYALIDETGGSVAAGEPGELVLRSRHLALGEWTGGKMVEGRMRPDPDRSGLSIFHTGDLMRTGMDGLLRFVSRADRLLKINGVRVEPAEIEAVIRREPGVRDVVVMGRARDQGVALDAFVAAPDADALALRGALQARLRSALPQAMRPGRFFILDTLPSLPNGKADAPAMRRMAEASDAATATGTEGANA